MRTVVKKFDIPIYEVVLYVVVSDNIAKERKKMTKFFGPPPKDIDYALCSSYKWRFGVFFIPESLTPKVIAHEVFHLTHRILEWVHADFEHEHAALLHGYLINLVTNAVKLK